MRRNVKKKNNPSVNIIANSNPVSPFTEQYRLIRNNIHFTSVDKEIQSIVITSPEPSDGKSTIAANLAIVLAQQEKQVVLLDADLRKPTIHDTFNVSNEDGLTSVLTKKLNIDKAIHHSYVPNLFILTSGPIPPNPSELLDSKAMEATMEKLKKMFDYIILDTPPILAVTDSQILANKNDGVVLVVASGKTQKDHALKAKGLLEKAKAHMLGVVVNSVKSNKKIHFSQYE